jgi:hypothetical protein
VDVRFSDREGNVSTARIVEAFACGNVGHDFRGIALARLDPSVGNIPIASLAGNALPAGQEIQVALVANELIRPAYCELHPSGHLVRKHGRGSPVRGVPGDSGGAWIFEAAAGKVQVVVGVIQGATCNHRGAASQPSVFRYWIDTTMGKYHANATWAPLNYS